MYSFVLSRPKLFIIFFFLLNAQIKRKRHALFFSVRQRDTQYQRHLRYYVFRLRGRVGFETRVQFVIILSAEKNSAEKNNNNNSILETNPRYCRCTIERAKFSNEFFFLFSCNKTPCNVIESISRANGR